MRQWFAFSRGCFYKCSYCVYNVPNQLQAKSGMAITKEIEYLEKFQCKCHTLKRWDN